MLRIIILKKELCVILTILCTLIGTNQTLTANAVHQKVFVFDIHGVLMETQYAQGIRSFLQNLFGICQNTGYICKNHFGNIRALKDALEQPANDSQKPNTPMWDMIRTLKQHGHIVMICSNIRPNTYEGLKRRFTGLFALIDDAVICGPATGWHTKDFTTLFEQIETLAQSKIPGIHLQDIIFVDDTRTYALRTSGRGWTSIYHITNESTIAALQQALLSST